MPNDLVTIRFDKILQARTYATVLLGNDEKKFAIYVDPQTGKSLQLYLLGSKRERPYTHDLIHSIFLGFNIRLKQIVINEVEDTIYFARLFLEQEREDSVDIVEIDCRPSDCLTLAAIYQIPVFCTKAVFEKVIPVEDV